MIHPPSAALSGARRLYQLFKNAVLLSLIRQKHDVALDQATQMDPRQGGIQSTKGSLDP